MVLFYFTNAALEISFGAAWWLTSKTTTGLYNGINYLIYGSNELTEEQIKEIRIIEFDDENEDKIDYKNLIEEIKSLKDQISDLKKT